MKKLLYDKKRQKRLRNPRTTLRLDYLKKPNVYDGVKEIAGNYGFVLIPYNKVSIYLRHFCPEKKRFGRAIKDYRYSIIGIDENLSYTARLVNLWLEYYSLIAREIKPKKQVELQDLEYKYPIIEDIKELCRFPADKSDYYFRKRIKYAVAEISNIYYNVWDKHLASQYIPIIDRQSEAFHNNNSTISFNNMLLVRLSDVHVRRFTHVMIYPRFGLELCNQRNDEILFYLISYLSYRYACCQNTREDQLKIGAKSLLEYIPVFKSAKEIKENYHSKYKEMIVKPLWDSLCRMPDTRLTEFRNGDEYYNVKDYKKDGKCPSFESLIRGYFLFDISEYNSALLNIIKDYDS